MNNTLNNLDDIFNPVPPAIKKIWPGAKLIPISKPVKKPKDAFVIRTKKDIINE